MTTRSALLIGATVGVGVYLGLAVYGAWRYARAVEDEIFKVADC